MRHPVRHFAQLAAAVVCLSGAALAWLQVTSVVDVPPVTQGQPPTVSVVYDPPTMTAVLVLATAAGVLTVLGVAGLRRRREPRP